ncbi:flavin reductase family protein [Sciscionella marina]|uniref:flavin reductase family protein n=1 Tax=Sciscionella marina TaxID=508770 RepID=UPI00036AE518|nr:flavin reductase family protein [Sciscionella marina]
MPGNTKTIDSGELGKSVAPTTLRAVAGTFTTGITIITCTADGAPQGCAANAVLSVSLEPPLMLISLGETSRTRVAVERAGAFAINVLPDNSKGSALCSVFAGRSDDKFASVDHYGGLLGAPVLTDALGWFECAIVTTQVAGDHTLFIGLVVDAGHVPGDPLVFFRGQNRKLAA